MWCGGKERKEANGKGIPRGPVTSSGMTRRGRHGWLHISYTLADEEKKKVMTDWNNEEESHGSLSIMKISHPSLAPLFFQILFNHYSIYKHYSARFFFLFGEHERKCMASYK